MEIIRHGVSSLAAGALAGLVAVGGLLATDVGGLTDMIRDDPSGWLVVLLLTVAFVPSFSLAAAAGALVRIASPEE
jgi:hypothetical protein